MKFKLFTNASKKYYRLICLELYKNICAENPNFAQTKIPSEITPLPLNLRDISRARQDALKIFKKLDQAFISIRLI